MQSIARGSLAQGWGAGADGLAQVVLQAFALAAMPSAAFDTLHASLRRRGFDGIAVVHPIDPAAC